MEDAMMSAIQLERWAHEADAFGAYGADPLAARSAKVLGRSPRFVEALGLPARLIAELPLPPSLGLHVPGVPGVVRVELDAVAAEAARADGELVLDAAEWRSVVTGAEADRLWPVDLVGLCRRKRSEPAFRIDAETALAGAQPDPSEAWTVGQVLERVGAEVLTIALP